jgi:hypothetical protein
MPRTADAKGRPAVGPQRVGLGVRVLSSSHAALVCVSRTCLASFNR